MVCIESQTLKSYTSCYAANIQKVHDVLNVVPFKTRSNLLKNKFFFIISVVLCRLFALKKKITEELQDTQFVRLDFTPNVCPKA